MKAIIYISVIVGAWMLPISEGLRDSSMSMVLAVTNAVERFMFRGDEAEIRTIDGSEFDITVNEPGRIVVVIIDNKLTTASRQDSLAVDGKLKELPSKVLIAKVIAEDSAELMSRLNIPNVPNIRIYLRGKMVEEFRGSIDEKQLIKVIGYYLNDGKRPDNSLRPGSGSIDRLNDEWLPEGIERKSSKPKR